VSGNPDHREADQQLSALPRASYLGFHLRAGDGAGVAERACAKRTRAAFTIDPF
jgi:hypothetical protein